MADPIVCSSGCKRSLPDIDTASDAGWECLPITGRYRCPECSIDLWRVNERFAEKISIDAAAIAKVTGSTA